MAGNSGGPWGGGGGSGGDDNRGDKNDGRRPPNRPNEGAPIPEIDELVNKGREQLRVLMGGGNGGGRGGASGEGGNGPALTRRHNWPWRIGCCCPLGHGIVLHSAPRRKIS